MTAVVLDSYSGPDALRVEQRPVPKPGKDEILVKVAASPINPSDLAFLGGNYGFDKPPPVVPGGEGSGTVVAVGPGAMGRYFLGKRVACLSNGQRDGIWAEYVVASAKGGRLPTEQIGQPGTRGHVSYQSANGQRFPGNHRMTAGTKPLSLPLRPAHSGKWSTAWGEVRGFRLSTSFAAMHRWNYSKRKVPLSF